jgi:valyl-tRNA synthetase
MSKSKGNVVTPQGMLDEHGSDAVRYWAASSRLGTDAAFDPENPKQIKIGRRLAIKVLNAAKFVYSFPHTEDAPITEPIDIDLLKRLAEVVRIATESYDKFDHARALEVTEQFFWTFTDDYLELVKERAYNQTDAGQASAALALRRRSRRWPASAAQRDAGLRAAGGGPGGRTKNRWGEAAGRH